MSNKFCFNQFISTTELSFERSCEAEMEDAHILIIYSYLALKCLGSFSKRQHFIFPKKLVYEDLKLVTDEKIEDKLKK